MPRSKNPEKSTRRTVVPSPRAVKKVAGVTGKEPRKPVANRTARESQPAPPSPPGVGEFSSLGSREAFQHFTGLARAHEPVSFNGDGALVLTNVLAGIEAITPHLDRAPEVGVSRAEIEEIPAIARALQFATLQVIDRAASSREIADRLQALRPLRELALKAAELLAHPLVQLAPRERVAAIRAGSGPIDLAQDAVALQGLFHDLGASVAGKHPVTEAQLQQLGTEGEWLLSRLRRGNAPIKRSPGPSPEADIRDRIWSLLQLRHDQLWLLGSKVWGPRQVGEHIPLLLARQAAARVASPTTPAPERAPG
jgi:hypothetical protein